MSKPPTKKTPASKKKLQVSVKSLLEGVVRRVVEETVQEASGEGPMLIDVGSEAEKQVVLRSILASLDDAEKTRGLLVSAMKEETDPSEVEIYRAALAKFNDVIRDKHEMIQILAKGTSKLRGGNKLPEGRRNRQ